MPSTLTELTASIVSAHAATVEMTQDELLAEIRKVYTTLKALEEGTVAAPEQPAEAEAPPVMSARKSIQKNQIICLECGKGGFKTLVRHLKQAHSMTAIEYRKKHGLPSGTRLAAKAYSEARRESALKNNLGEKLAKGREAYQAKQKTANEATKAKPAPKKTALAKKPAVKKESPK
jgi:predicted transcriptional regulator